MTYPSRGRRRVPVWAWILSAVAVIVALMVALVAAGIIGYGVASTGDNEVERDKRFTATDLAGSSSCDRLDMYINGIGSWPDVQDAASQAKTEAVRIAGSARRMYDACVAAGANMSTWREPTG